MTIDTDDLWIEFLTAPHEGEDYGEYLEQLEAEQDYEAGLDAWAAETEQR